MHCHWVFPFQYNQWVCVATEGRTQDFPAESSVAAPQSQVSERLPPTACILCCTVPGERPQSHRTGVCVIWAVFVFTF